MERVLPYTKAPAYAGFFKICKMAATVGFFQITSPKRSRRGKERSCVLRNCKTRLSDLTRRNVVKMRSRRSWISRLGSLWTLRSEERRVGKECRYRLTA